MSISKETEVLVVGAGPVGLCTGLMLAERGIRVEIIDQHWRTSAHSYALALHPSSLQTLDELGLAHELVEEGHCVEKVLYYEGMVPRAEVAYAKLPGHFPFLLILAQDALEGALETRLAKKGVKVHWNHRAGFFDAEAPELTVRVDKLTQESVGYAITHSGWVVDRTFEVRPRFIVGTDGQHSVVRRHLGLDFQEQGHADMFAVFEFETDGTASPEVRVIFDGRFTNVLWPQRGGRYRWGFQLPEDQVTEPRSKNPLAVQIHDRTYPYLGREQLTSFIADRASWFDPPIGEIIWSLGVRFERRLVDQFGKGWAWLAGDAAHLAGPVGVHSMNVGLREARDVADRLYRILREGHGPETLKDYDQERLSEWRSLLTGKARVLDGADPWVSEYADRLVHCVPASGSDLHVLLGELGLALE